MNSALIKLIPHLHDIKMFANNLPGKEIGKFMLIFNGGSESK